MVGWGIENAGVDFLQCRPSEIAAAVALYVSGERQAASNINKAMSGFEQEVKVNSCAL